MTTNHLCAVLAKNELARHIAVYITKGVAINSALVTSLLEDIEKFTGTGNQEPVKQVWSTIILEDIPF
jgi:hypothetical protein